MLQRRERPQARLLARAGTDPFSAATLRRLTRAFIATCIWPREKRGVTWQHGDYRFLVVELVCARGDRSFMQVWAEPFDGTIVIEASSGRFAPLCEGAASARKRAAVLSAQGFSLPRRGLHNWRCEPPEPDETRCAVLARTMLGLLRDAFGHDGCRPLRLTVGQGSRLYDGRLLRALRPDRLAQILREMEFEPEPHNGIWRCRSAAGHPFHAGLAAPVEGREPELHGLLMLHAGIEVEGDESGLALFLAQETMRLSVHRPQPGRVVLLRQERLTGGLTPDAVRLMIGDFADELDNVLARLAEITPPAGR